MSTLTKTIIGILLFIAVSIITYRAINLEPSDSISPNNKVIAIMNNSGCAVCHNKKHNLPFYSKLPVVGSNIKKKEAIATAKIDNNEVLENIKSGKVIDSITLYKIERVIIDGSMPPFSYTILRLGAGVSSKEQEIFLNWISMYKDRHYNLESYLFK